MRGVDKKPLGTIASLLLCARLMGSSLLYLTLFVREHGGVGKAQLLSGVKIKNQNVTEDTGQLEKANKAFVARVAEDWEHPKAVDVVRPEPQGDKEEPCPTIGTVWERVRDTDSWALPHIYI